jgi:hypothetical protein
MSYLTAKTTPWDEGKAWSSGPGLLTLKLKFITLFIDNLSIGGYTLWYFTEVAFIKPVIADLSTKFKNIKEISLFRPQSSIPAPAASSPLRLP